MSKSIIILLLATSFLSSCTGQTKTEPQTLYNDEFKWTITIPENFANIEASEWKKMQNKGLDAVEDTYGEKVENQTEIIFVFKNADFNYLESNYQPYDIEIDGDYLSSCQVVNEVLFETFQAQMPGAKIDSVSSVEKINNLEFQTYKMKLDFPNGMTMYSHMYSRLFGKKEFSVNIMYVDEKQGEKMTKAWYNSKFE